MMASELLMVPWECERSLSSWMTFSLETKSIQGLCAVRTCQYHPTPDELGLVEVLASIVQVLSEEVWYVWERLAASSKKDFCASHCPPCQRLGVAKSIFLPYLF